MIVADRRQIERSAREPMHPAVDVNDLAGDVARERRSEERDQIGHVFGLAEIADRDICIDERFAVLGRRM